MEDVIRVERHKCNNCQFFEKKEELIQSVMLRPNLKKARLSWFAKLLIFLKLLDCEDRIIEIGKFAFPGWNGHLLFWLFHCFGCDRLSSDYAHGYTSDGSRQGLLYFTCGNCGAQTLLYGWKFYKDLEKMSWKEKIWCCCLSYMKVGVKGVIYSTLVFCLFFLIVKLVN